MNAKLVGLLDLIHAAAMPRQMHDRLMMLGDEAFRALLSDIIEEVTRRSLKNEDSIKKEGKRHQKEQEEDVETEMVRAKSRDNMSMLDDGLFGELVCDVYTELCRRYPSLQLSMTGFIDKMNFDMSIKGQQVTVREDSLDSVERLLSQLYTMTFAATNSTPSICASAHSCDDDNLAPFMDVSEANARVRELEETLQRQQVHITELEVANKNLQFMREDYAQKCHTYEHLLTTIQGKLDAVHLEQLELMEARKDQDAMMATLGTKVSSCTFLFA
jgi:hypothetical protein